MASVNRPASSGSDSDPRDALVDERKRKRMLSNRESARRSRMKKQKRVEELVSEITALQNKNSVLNQNISISTQRYVELESANNVLRAQAVELTDRLLSLNTVLQIVEEVSGLGLEIPDVPDPLMEPWKLPFPELPIMASADPFLC